MNARREKIPVEPLSRRAWERVEAGLFERLADGEHFERPQTQRAARRRRAGIWLGAAGVAAAAAILLWWQVSALPELAQQEMAQQEMAQQEMAQQEMAQQEMAQQEMAPVVSEQVGAPEIDTPAPSLAEGTRIVTTTGPTQTTVGDSVVTIAEHSVLRVAGGDAEGWLLTLHEGQVDCLVAPRRQRPPFVVLAGDTRISVVGTSFKVTRQGSGALVAVAEGKVRVESGGKAVLLGPGSVWPEPERSAKSAAKKSASARRPTSRARPSQRFELATQLEASDPEAALRIYRELGRRRGPWAPNALYAQARLELDRGNTAVAERLLERYLEAYAQGANAADARQLLNKLRER